MNTFDSHLEGKEKYANGIIAGYKTKDVQKAKQEALKELNRRRIEVETYEDALMDIFRHEGKYVLWEDVEKCFGRME